MILMGIVCRLSAGDGSAHQASKLNAWSGVAVAAVISLLSPLMWTTWRPRWLPWPIESYINGVHTFDKPQPWLFPVFPWAAFAFVGMAAGFLILSDWARSWEAKLFTGAGALGASMIGVGHTLDASSLQIYAVDDFWHTSPNFFLIRVGILLVILSFAHGWCTWGLGQKGFSPLLQLGKTSLLVYWVHIEFVYGKFSILPKRACSASTATFGLAVICVAMLLLSMARTTWKTRTAHA